MKYWYEEYQNLDLRNGTIEFICDDDQDMIEIRYKDGMVIDVGYIEDDKKYYITIIKADDLESWNNPLAEYAVVSKDRLFDEIQKVILEFRK